MSHRPPHDPPVLDYAAPRAVRETAFRTFLRGYFWLILKNVIGWLLILASPVLGITIPGPGGIPIFLIGFALVTFPGKRRITTRFMRGRPMRLEAGIFTFLVTLVSVAVTVGGMWFTLDHYKHLLAAWGLKPAAILGVGLVGLGVTWVVTWLALRLANLILTGIPRARRTMRPWLRRRGIRLLPPRHPVAGEDSVDENEIFLIDPRHSARAKRAWVIGLPWLKRALALGLTLGIFGYILWPIYEQWPLVRDRVWETNWYRFGGAVAMFAAFLFGVRALAWRELLAGLGHRLPIAPATRIWSTSELARYLPGVIWQVVGRVFLVKPYGVSGAVCSTSQFLELALFLLANVLVAVSTCFYFGWRNIHGEARYALLVASMLVPLLGAIVWPPIFYGGMNGILRLLGKPAVTKRVKAGRLFGVLGWYMGGLLWQGAAIWVVAGRPLGLPPEKWWVVAGSYCLAWTAGFVAIWAPGGLGVRELVFVLVMRWALPESVQALAADEVQLEAFLAFLAILLRLWATAGELVVAAGAYSADLRGAMGRADAKGRVKRPAAEPVRV